MRRAPTLQCLALAMSFVLLSASCTTSRVHVAEGGAQRATHAPDTPRRGSARTGKAQQSQVSDVPQQQHLSPGPAHLRLLPVGFRELDEGRWQLLFPPRPLDPSLELLSLVEVRPLLDAFSSLGTPPAPRLRLLEVPGAGRHSQRPASDWEARLPW